MFQKSVYYKMLSNGSTFPTEQKAVKQLVPSEGSVQILPVPLRIFGKMTTLVGPDFDMDRLTNPIIEIG